MSSMAEVAKRIVPTRMAVPSYQEVHGEGDTQYTVFVVEVETLDGDRKFLKRRYNAFLNMHKELKASEKYPTITNFNFPGKNFLRGASSTKEDRRERFDKYVQELVQINPMPPALEQFLSDTGKVQQALHKSTLRNIIRSQNRPAESDIKTINSLMSKPTLFLKFGRRGEPHWRKFNLVYLDNLRGPAIRWETKKKKNLRPPEILISSMQEIRFGQHSSVFERKKMPHLETLSFSVMYRLRASNKIESLDLIAKHPDDFFVWTVGLNDAIKKYKEGIPFERSKSFDLQALELDSDRELMAEFDDIDIFNDEEKEDDHDHDHEDDHEEEDDRLITTGNVMFSWGNNNWGQLGLVDVLNDQHVVPAGIKGTACRPVEHKEDTETSAKKGSLEVGRAFDIQNIACGGNFTVAIDSRMKAYIWGHGSICGGVTTATGRRGQHVFQPSPLKQPFRSTPVALAAAGEQHVLFLSQSGDVFACGINDSGQLGLGDLKDRGTPERINFANGANNSAPTPIDATMKVVACGHSTSAVISSEGVLYTWGCNMYGALGLGEGEGEEKEKEKEKGGGNHNYKMTPHKVATELDETWEVKQISCGNFHMAAILVERGRTSSASTAPNTHGSRPTGLPTSLKSLTKVVTWGWNGCGQLGIGDFVDQSTPQIVEVLSGGGKMVESVVCGAAHCAAIVNITMGELEIIGQLWTWGCGVAATANSGAHHADIPRPLHLTKKGHESVEIFRIAAGDNFTLILDGEGAMMLIGANPVNEGSEEGCMIPLVLQNSDIKGVDNIVTGVAAGGRHIGVLAPKRFPASTLF